MNSHSLSAIAVGLLAVTSQAAEPSIPYLETAPITILWQFNTTVVDVPRSDVKNVGTIGSTTTPPTTGATTGSTTTGTHYVNTPNGLDPVERITTEKGKPAAYSVATGNQAFFVAHLFRNVLEYYAEDSKAQLTAAAAADANAEAARATAAAARAHAAAHPESAAEDLATAMAADAEALYYATIAESSTARAEDDETQIQTIKREISDKWELTAVRKPQTTLAGLMGEDYRIYLTRIDALRGRIIRGYDTGMRLVAKYSTPKITETLNGDTLVKASGSVTSYFSLEIRSLDAADPLYLVPLETRPSQVEGEDYNTNGEDWDMFAGGYMTYQIRSIAGTPVTLAPSKMKITGTGSWYHTLFNFNDHISDYYAGTAPLNISMGEVKYQRSEYFPDFFENTDSGSESM